MQVAALIIAGISLVIAALAVTWCFALAQRIRKMAAVRGELARIAAAGDLTGLAAAVENALSVLAVRDEQLGAELQAQSDRLRTSIRHVGLVRFDALPGDVGEQSFAVALLDEFGTGFVLTSMYGAGAYRLYAKPITEGVADLVLTGEELEAANSALGGTGMQVISERRARAGV